MKGLSKGRYDETFAGEDVENRVAPYQLASKKPADMNLHRL